MKHLSIRFFIGLRTASDPFEDPNQSSGSRVEYDLRAERALSILSHHYPALSAHRGTGYWKGQAEPNLQVEVVMEIDERDPNWPEMMESEAVGRAQSVAGEIARALNQESVALAVSEVRFTLEGPNGAV